VTIDDKAQHGLAGHSGHRPLSGRDRRTRPLGLVLPQKTATSTSAYFLAGGTLRWPVIGLALFSTNISTIHLVSLAWEGYVNGLA
jgi:hypothetical protein